MKQYMNYCALFLLIITTSGFAEQITNNNNYWQCTTQDGTSKQWVARSIYKKIALNVAYSGCKKDSQAPMTCKATQASCEHYIDGMSVQPMWQCTALDQVAEAWQSNLYPQRIDAALAAKAYCKEKSVVPETCYISLVTCLNRNGFSANGL